MAVAALRQSPEYLEGIGRTSAAALEAKGIRTLIDMLHAGPRAVHHALPRASVKQVRHWFFAAHLLQVPGVTPDLAEMLVDNGIFTFEALAGAALQRLEKAAAAAKKARRLKARPSLYALAAVQRAAGRLRGTGVISGRVLSRRTGRPIKDAVVMSAGQKDVTDRRGAFVLARLPEGRVRLRIEAPGRFPVSATAQVHAREYHRAITVRLADASDDARQARAPIAERDGKAITSARGRAVKLVVRSLAEMPDDTYLCVRRVTSTGAVRLMHLYRTSTAREIRADVVDVAASVLPPGTKPAAVLHYKDGALARTGLTRRDVAVMIFRRAFGPLRLSVKKRYVKPGRREASGEIDG